MHIIWGTWAKTAEDYISFTPRSQKQESVEVRKLKIVKYVAWYKGGLST